ncbi:MAG: carbohydrate binding domain-containing protein [Pseudomonadota bacterium]
MKNLIQQLIKVSPLFICISTTGISFNTAAQTIIEKPSVQRYGAAFGKIVVQHAGDTLVSSSSDTVLKSGEFLRDGNSESQGSVYLFQNGNATPKAVYQFPGSANHNKKLGAKIALSNKWLAFTEGNVDETNVNVPARVFIVGRDGNNQWRTCPASPGTSTEIGVGVDCTNQFDINGVENRGRPLKSIEFAHLTAKAEHNHNIAISDNYLVMADIKGGEIITYRYDASQNTWKEDLKLNVPDYLKLGTAIAIEGDRLAMSAPGVSGFFTFKRNTTLPESAWTGKWTADTSITNSGHVLDMNSNRIIVGGTASDNVSGTLSFYNFDTSGNLIFNHTLTTPVPPVSVALFSDTAVAAFEIAEPTAISYKLNSSVGRWQEFERIPRSIVPADPKGRAFFTRSADLHSGVIALGWDNWSSSSLDRPGAVVLRNFTPNCKSPSNLVPNCSYDIPTATNWSLTAYNGASAWVNYNGNQMLTTINNAGSDFWHVQARTSVSVTAGTYTLRFNAKATSARSIQINLGHRGGTWQSYAQQTVNLTNTMQTFTLTLPNIPTDINSVLDFNLGKSSISAVTLDEVSLVKNL